MIIDRIESEYAVCETEDGQIVNVPIIELPAGAKEGDALIFTNAEYEIDVQTTHKLRTKVQNLLKDLSK